MTELRKRKCPRCGEPLNHISDWVNRLMQGIGHRNSSFCDIDDFEYRPKTIIADDGATHRFIVQELKHEGETGSRGQTTLLDNLSHVPEFTVWGIVKRKDGRVGWRDFRYERQEIISEAEYQDRYRRWWNNQPIDVVLANMSRLDLEDVWR